MSFTLQLTPDLVSVEPGASVPISIVIHNRGESRERFEMEIEGVDPEWKAVPVPVFEADAGEKHSERFFFKPPRASESVAGDYPFVVRVRSLETGATQIMQGVLQVKPFHHLSMEVSPKRGIVSPVHRNSTFEVTLMNLGNSEHTVRVLAGDAEEECAYELESDQIIVGPGAQRQVEMTVSPKRNPWFTSGRLVGISISARSVDTPSVTSTSQAQLEQRPLLSIATLAIGVICAVVFFAWYLARPKPVVFDVTADHSSVKAGDPVTISWHMRGANRVLIKTPTDVIYDGTATNGEKTYTPSTAGALTIDATATQDGGDEKKVSIPINVMAPEQVDPPEIVFAKPASERINLGESFRLNYKLGSSVTKATLQPDGIDLSTDLSEVLVKPTSAGLIPYMVDAQNSKGEHTTKQFSITVVEPSDASILWFDVTPREASPDVQTVTVSWKVSTNAQLVTLQRGADQPIVEDLNGKQDFPVTTNTEFKLVAKDQNNRSTSQRITVKYVVPKINATPPLSTVPGAQPTPTPPSTAGAPPNTTGSTTAGGR